MQKIIVYKIDQIEAALLILTNQTNYFKTYSIAELLIKKH